MSNLFVPKSGIYQSWLTRQYTGRFPATQHGNRSMACHSIPGTKPHMKKGFEMTASGLWAAATAEGFEEVPLNC
jgi:hypothetical protein